MSTSFFFFNDTATTEIYTLSLHDALPISSPSGGASRRSAGSSSAASAGRAKRPSARTVRRTSSWPWCRTSCARRSTRSEEHTSELQSRLHLVCRLLLEKKKMTEYVAPDK